jgi:hypothetical protein
MRFGRRKGEVPAASAPGNAKVATKACDYGEALTSYELVPIKGVEIRPHMLRSAAEVARGHPHSPLFVFTGYSIANQQIRYFHRIALNLTSKPLW